MDYQFYILIIKSKYGVIHKEKLSERIFDRFIRDTQFTAIRSGRLPINAGSFSNRIEPVFSNDAGNCRNASAEQTASSDTAMQANATGFKVRVESGGSSFQKAFSRDCLKPLIKRIGKGLVLDGILALNETFGFLLVVSSKKREITSAGHESLKKEKASSPLDIIEVTIADLTDNRYNIKEKALTDFSSIVPVGSITSKDTLPVYIDRSVTEAIIDHSRLFPQCEVGGILLGNLCSDNGSSNLFLHVTNQIIARNAVSTQAQLRFTSSSWDSILSKLKSINLNHSIIGYWHSHVIGIPSHQSIPQKAQSEKANNDLVKKQELTRLFYSIDDLFVHESHFPAPWMISAVVDPIAGQSAVGVGDLEISIALYGWNDGFINSIPRYFVVTEGGGKA